MAFKHAAAPTQALTWKKPGRNDPCWCGSGRKYKTCHEAFDNRILSFERQGITVPRRELLKKKEDIEGIKESAKINIAALDAVSEKICEGMTTLEIDKIVDEVTRGMGGIPAPFGYEGFPKSCCTSINEQVCHGIPSDKDVLKSGDIINVDCSTEYRGYFSDSSRMFLIGDVSPEKRNLVETAKGAMQAGIDAVKPWICLGDMGDVVHKYAVAGGCSVVREIGGHGIGFEFHEEPYVSYVSRPGTEMLMVPGFVFTIEPMVNMGDEDIYIDDDNGWTVYTRDGKPSAQWEVQVVVTEEGCEVLSW
ncbi:MAG: methionyl aminopeptidase [Lachnospiraceae bacterium]|nr:methionyl aminopeptidase [Lachnospiraceae bacterium]